MTESEWLACEHPSPMLLFLYDKASERKFRLFACACVRRIQRHFPDARYLTALEVAERFADGMADANEWQAAADAIVAAGFEGWTPYSWQDPELEMRLESALGAESALAARSSVAGQAAPAVPTEASYSSYQAACSACKVAAIVAERKRPALRYRRDSEHPVKVAEHYWQSSVLRCVFGNPFHPVSIEPGWVTPTVTNLAVVAYDKRRSPGKLLDPVRLAVLADALEDAGCQDADLLGHLRHPGPHVPGCWPVDLLLGKTRPPGTDRSNDERQREA